VKYDGRRPTEVGDRDLEDIKSRKKKKYNRRGNKGDPLGVKDETGRIVGSVKSLLKKNDCSHKAQEKIA